MNNTKAIAVIGAGYGDEGKGLMTDCISDYSENPIVIRCNGGAQAGHTVVLPENQNSPEVRHINGHFGSGTLNGTPTYLSNNFVSSPLYFEDEWNRLKALGVDPLIFVDWEGIITTPYDIFINRAVETFRTQKHGSCGAGFGETIERNLKANKGFGLRVMDLFDDTLLEYLLKCISEDYLRERLTELGVPLDCIESSGIQEEKVYKNFMKSVEFFLNKVGVVSPEFCLRYNTLVFEGAQGLMLDQDHKNFPYVTRSNTGLKNIVEFCENLKIESVAAIYTTRCYKTRHGAGPLKNELPNLPEFIIEDPTNTPNPYQDQIRYAYLDIDELADTIEEDIAKCKSSVEIKKWVAVTCLDQLVDKENVPYYINNELKHDGVPTFLETIDRVLVPERSYESWGNTRTTVL